MSEFELQNYLRTIVDQSQRVEDWRDDRYVETQAQLPLKVQTVKQRESLEQGQQEILKRFDLLTGLREFYPSEPVLLIGKPGSGKSTALRRLLLEEAQGWQDGALIPVLILLRSCRQGLVVDWIAAALDVEVGEARSLLKAQRLLLMFDGLNEVPNPDAYQALTDFLEKPGFVPMVFTTRELGADASLGIERRLEMVPLTESQMREFIEMRLPGQGDVLLRQLGDRLRDLAETPLLLKMLCQVFEQSGEIPQNRGELFRNKFIQDFDAIKHRGVVAADSGFFEFKDDLLQHLAMKMIVGNGSPTGDVLQIEKSIAQGWLKDWLAQEQVSNAGEKARKWLDDLIKFHILQVAGNAKEIEFHHQLFQEYYAAEWLLGRVRGMDDETLECEFLNLLKWTETVGLMLGLVEDEGLAIRVVEKALGVDLMLGARLAGAVRSGFQATTVKCVSQKQYSLVLIVLLLAEIASHEVIPALEEILQNNDDDKIRELAIIALGKTKSEQAISILKSARNGTELVRGAIPQALQEVATPSAILLLREWKEEEETPYVHIRIEIALWDLCGEEEKPSLFRPIVIDDFDNGGEEISYLKEVYGEINLSTIGQAIRFDNSCLRELAIESLAQIPGSKATKLLIEGLKSDLIDESNHWNILMALETRTLDQKDIQDLVALLPGCLAHGFPLIRETATKIMGRFSDRNIITALTIALSDTDSRVRNAAIDSLSNIGGKAGIELLGKHLSSQFSEDYSSAIIALGNTSSDLAVPYLLEILNNTNDFTDEFIAVKVFSALGKTAGGDLVPYLISLRNISMGHEIIQALVTAIAAIQSNCKFYNYEIHQKAQTRHLPGGQQPTTGSTVYITTQELTLMSTQPPIFNQQNATIGVNYAAENSNPHITQNIQTQSQSSETALLAIIQIIQALEQKHSQIASPQQTIEIIDAEFKELKASQPLQWQNLLSVKRLYNGGKKAALKLGEHFAEENPWGKGLVAFLEGFSEDVK